LVKNPSMNPSKRDLSLKDANLAKIDNFKKGWA